MKQKSKIILFRIIPIVLIILTFVMLFSTTPSITSNAKTRKLNTNVWNTDLVELKEQETNQTTTGFISITNFYTFSGSNFVASDSTKVTSFQSNMQILIESAEELYCFTLLCNSEYKQQYLSYNYALGSNIDYTDASKQRLFALPIGWVTSSELNIAESKDAFQGTFDGRGFSISNLFYDPIDDEVEYNEKYQSSLMYYSLFSTVGKNGTVKNLGLISPVMLQAIPFGLMTYASSLIGVNFGNVNHVFVQDFRTDSGLTAEGGFFVSGLMGTNNGIFTQAYVAIRTVISQSVSYYRGVTPMVFVNSTNETMDATFDNLYYDNTLFRGTTIYSGSLGNNQEVQGLPTSSFADGKYFSSSNEWYSNGTYTENGGQSVAGLLQLTYPVLIGLKVINGNQYEIESPMDLVYMSELISKYPMFQRASYLLRSDIDMSTVPAGSYLPIGTTFSGIFESEQITDIDNKTVELNNGRKSNYHGIYNLTLNEGFSNLGYHSYGLFPYLSGTVRNINLVNAKIEITDIDELNKTDINTIGFISGKLEKGTISNVNVVGNISLKYSTEIGATYVGGIVGYGNGGTIENCTTNGKIDGSTQLITPNNYNDTRYNNIYSVIGGIIGYNDNVANLKNCLNTMEIIAMKFNNETSRTIYQYVGGCMGYGTTIECSKLANYGNIEVGEDGVTNQYFGTNFIGGVIGCTTGGTSPVGSMINVGTINYYLSHAQTYASGGITSYGECKIGLDNLNHVSGVLNLYQVMDMEYYGLSSASNLNIVNNNGVTSDSLIINVAGVLYAYQSNVTLTGVYNLNETYELTNDSSEIYKANPLEKQIIDISIINEYAPCVVTTGGNQDHIVTIKQSYNEKEIEYNPTTTVNAYDLKLSGNCSGTFQAMENVRNEGNVTINFDQTTTTKLDKYFDESGDYKKLKLFGILEEVSMGCTIKNVYNGGDLELYTTQNDIYFNVYVTGICYKNANTFNSEPSENLIISSTREGSIHNCINNGDITIHGNGTSNAAHFYGVSRAGGITAVNAGLISTCYNLGDVYNCNSTLTHTTNTCGDYAGEFEMETGGICFLMLDEAAQIMDSANNGNIYSVAVGSSSVWVNAAGIAVRNEKNEAGQDKSSNETGYNVHASRQKIEFTINYGNVYAYNGYSRDNASSTYEPQCKAAGFLCLGVCNIVNCINYGNVYGTKVVGGLYGLVFIYKFDDEMAADSRQGIYVYIANSINYGEIKTIPNTVVTKENAATLTKTAHKDGSYPCGALIGYIASNQNNYLEVSNVLTYMKISYLVNLADDVNIVGRVYRINSTNNEANRTAISEAIAYMATTADEDTSPAPFNATLGGNQYHIKSYSKDVAEPNPDATPEYSKAHNGGIFNEKYPLRTKPENDPTFDSIASNQYIYDYIQFVPYSKVNEYLADKIGLTATIYQTALDALMKDVEGTIQVFDALMSDDVINQVYDSITSSNLYQNFLNSKDAVLTALNELIKKNPNHITTYFTDFTQDDNILSLYLSDETALDTLLQTTFINRDFNNDQLNELFNQIMNNQELLTLLCNKYPDTMSKILNEFINNATSEQLNQLYTTISTTTLFEDILENVSMTSLENILTILFDNVSDEIIENIYNSIKDTNLDQTIQDRIEALVSPNIENQYQITINSNEFTNDISQELFTYLEENNPDVYEKIVLYIQTNLFNEMINKLSNIQIESLWNSFVLDDSASQYWENIINTDGYYYYPVDENIYLARLNDYYMDDAAGTNFTGDYYYDNGYKTIESLITSNNNYYSITVSSGSNYNYNNNVFTSSAWNGNYSITQSNTLGNGVVWQRGTSGLFGTTTTYTKINQGTHTRLEKTTDIKANNDITINNKITIIKELFNQMYQKDSSFGIYISNQDGILEQILSNPDIVKEAIINTSLTSNDRKVILSYLSENPDFTYTFSYLLNDSSLRYLYETIIANVSDDIILNLKQLEISSSSLQIITNYLNQKYNVTITNATVEQYKDALLNANNLSKESMVNMISYIASQDTTQKQIIVDEINKKDATTREEMIHEILLKSYEDKTGQTLDTKVIDEVINSLSDNQTLQEEKEKYLIQYFFDASNNEKVSILEEIALNIKYDNTIETKKEVVEKGALNNKDILKVLFQEIEFTDEEKTSIIRQLLESHPEYFDILVQDNAFTVEEKIIILASICQANDTLFKDILEGKYNSGLSYNLSNDNTLKENVEKMFADVKEKDPSFDGTKYTDNTGIYALASSSGILNGEFIPDNMDLSQLDPITDATDELPKTDSSWRGGNNMNPNAYPEQNKEKYVNYRVYYMMKQLKKSIATNIFEIELVGVDETDTDLSTADETYLVNTSSDEIHLDTHEVHFYIPYGSDEFNHRFFKVYNQEGHFQLSSGASFIPSSILLIEIPEDANVGDIIQTTITVQAEDETVTREYTIYIHITEKKSGTITSIYTNDTLVPTNNYQLSNNRTSAVVYETRSVQALNGTLEVNFDMVNIANYTDLKSSIKLYRASLQDDSINFNVDEEPLYSITEEVDGVDINTTNSFVEFRIVQDENIALSNINGTIINAVYDTLTSTWNNGTLKISLRFADKLPSGWYVLQLKLTTSDIYNVKFYRSPNSNNSITSLAYKGNEADIDEANHTITSKIPYGYEIREEEFGNYKGIYQADELKNEDGSCKIGYLDSIVISPRAQIEISEIAITNEGKYKEYQITYIVTSETNGQPQIYHHILQEEQVEPVLISSVYQDGSDVTQNDKNSFNDSFTKDKTPTYLITYELTNIFFKEGAQTYLKVSCDVLDTEGIYYSINITDGSGFEISFYEQAPSQTYTFTVTYQKDVEYNQETTLHWGDNEARTVRFAEVIITKEKNTNSRITNAVFISDSVLSNIDTIVHTEQVVIDNSTDGAKNPNSYEYLLSNDREIVVLPNQIYYNNVPDSVKEFWIIGIVDRTNLENYTPHFELPEDATIYKIKTIEDTVYRYASYLSNDTTSIYLVSEDGSKVCMEDGTPIEFTGDPYSELVIDGTTYTFQETNGTPNDITMTDDFNATIGSDGQEQFNYVDYRVYSEAWIDDNQYHTDYHVAVKDKSNVIRFDITVRFKDENIKAQANNDNLKWISMTFDNYEASVTAGNVTYSETITNRMTMFSYVSDDLELTHNNFATNIAGRYVINIEMPKGYTFSIVLIDKGQTQNIEGNVLELGTSIVTRTVYVDIIIDYSPVTLPWGQHLEKY